MKQRMIVFSADAMVGEDLEYLSTLPNYRKYLAKSSRAKSVKSIYPSLTFPAHVSMISGNYPEHHGVYSNSECMPGDMGLRWHFFYKSVKGGDIFTAAKAKGLSTASVWWPVTVGHPAVDHLMAVYWKQSPEDTFLDAHRRAGSDEGMIKIMEKYLNDGWTERVSPGFDEFKINVACDTIKTYKPDILAVHPINIDSYRHHYGVFNDMVRRGIEETDRWIGRLFLAMEEAGVQDETNFFLVSDHGQMDTKRRINFNVLLAEKGLLKVDENGKLADWDAYCHSGGMSALIYLKDPQDPELYRKTEKVLREIMEGEVFGVGQVFTKREVLEKEHLDGDFSFVIESDGYSAFSDGWTRPLVKPLDSSDYRYGKATHGYLPEKGPQPVFLAAGPAIKEGELTEACSIIDEAPTYAKILGVDLPDAVGVSMDAILKL
ncbi:MAG: alkaline phosphatase family protein [Treponema sp.]|jgi:predicted AlkP superfamily pyrophosphatase or phosphodiesterase|nr:alkaline phosphatase family protein [Treponema sp.]